MIIAECVYCGARRYDYTEGDALEKLKKHRCSATLRDKELEEILYNICEKTH